MLFGAAGMERLAAAHVAVFGIGGVGGYAVEALARSGIGELSLFDDDRVCLTNINRQLHATHATVGRYKVELAGERITQINPAARVHVHKLFYLPETADQVDLSIYDYVIDAIDTVAGKIELAVRAEAGGVRLISAMGAGNKLDATMFRVADIYETKVCPLAKVMRRELKKRGVRGLKVVYSREVPINPMADSLPACAESCVCPPGTTRNCSRRRHIPGSNAFVPAAAGLILAGEVVRELVG